MDTSKIFTVLCGFLLLICLTLSITTLVVLRNAVDETNAWQTQAEALVDELGGCVATLNDSQWTDGSVSASTNPSDSESETQAEAYWIRETNGKIGIYTDDGYLVQLTDIVINTLPAADRQAIESGICADSWQAVIRLMQSYE